MTVPSGATTSTVKVFVFLMVKLATRAVKKVIIRLGHQRFGNIERRRVEMVDNTYTFCGEIRISWTEKQSDHGDADEMDMCTYQKESLSKVYLVGCAVGERRCHDRSYMQLGY